MTDVADPGTHVSRQSQPTLREAPAGPQLSLSPDEKRLFGQLFQAADTESVGVVTGDVAVKFFEKSRLDPRVLGEVSIRDFQSSPRLTGHVPA